MERKEFKQRLKGLFAWTLVMVLLMNQMQGGLVSVYAEGTDGTVNVPVNYYDVEYTEDGMPNYIAIKEKDAAGEGEAYFATADYTTAVTLAEDATGMRNSELVFPTVEKAGYIFLDWEIGINGGTYVEADMPEDSGWDWSKSGDTALTLSETGIPFYANWRKARTIEITTRMTPDFENAGSIGEGIAGTYTETADSSSAEVYLTPVVTAEYGYLFVGWKCYDESGNEYIDRDYYVENMHETGISGYQDGTWLYIAFPEGDGTTEVLNASYILEAQFVDAEPLFVTMDSNDGTDETLTSFTEYRRSLYDSTIDFRLAQPSPREGYEFAGWLSSYDDKIYPGNADMSFGLDVGEVIFTAQWKKEIPITYETAGGKITSTDYDTQVMILTDATSVEEVVLPTVEKENSFFLNWELGVSSGGTYGTGKQNLSWDSTTPASSLTELPFTANWQDALTSTITYEYTGGMMNGVADSYGTLVTQPTMDSKTFEEPIIAYTPIKEGYIFTGWELQTSETGSGSYVSEKIAGNYGENYTLTAKWRPENVITITTAFAGDFENVGTIDPGMAGTYGESTQSDGNGNVVLFLPEVKDVEEGYFFVGWKCYDESGAEVALDGYVDVSDYDDTVISCYPANTSLTIAYPTDASNLGGNNASYVLEAQFKNAATVNVAFDLNGGTGDIVTEGIAYQEVYGEAIASIVMPEAPIREGYEFLGWCLEEEYYASGASVSLNVTLGEVTFVAKWQENEYTIPLSYNTSDGTITSTDYTKEVVLLATATGAEVVLPEVEREGYFFLNWELELSGGSTYAAGANMLKWSLEYQAMDLTNIPLKANWQPVLKSSISYDLDGGTLNGVAAIEDLVLTQPDTETTTFSVNAALEGTPVKKGYIFTGWKLEDSLEDGFNGIVSGSYGTNYTITALWRPEYVLHFTYSMESGYEEMGVVNGEAEITFNESVTAGPVSLTLPDVTNKTKENLFVGWKCFDDTGVEYKPDTEHYINGRGYPAGTMLMVDYVPSEDNARMASYRLVAQFVKADVVQIIQVVDEVQTTSLVYQSSADEKSFKYVLPDAPAKEGYEFSGWLNSIDHKVHEAGTTIEGTFEMSEVSITAQWIALLETGTHALRAGEPYKLSEGNWTINGDTTVYAGGGYFYVAEDCEYTFTEE